MVLDEWSLRTRLYLPCPNRTPATVLLTKNFFTTKSEHGRPGTGGFRSKAGKETPGSVKDEASHSTRLVPIFCRAEPPTFLGVRATQCNETPLIWWLCY